MTGSIRTYNHVPEDNPESIDLNPPDSWVRKLERLSTEVHENDAKLFPETAESIYANSGPQRPVDCQTAEWCIGHRQEGQLNWNGGYPWSEKVSFSIPAEAWHPGLQTSVSIVVAGVKGNQGKRDHPETFVVVNDAETWEWFK